jgi:tetratricopeptide (TPR) repeat protein
MLFAGCSLTGNTPVTRARHELATRYNIYFNAEEAYYEILKERSEAFRDDYAELLPLHPPLPATERPADKGPFDPVIDKTGIAILEHSITAKPRRNPAKSRSQKYRRWLRQEEFNPFLKNVWLLRGKACLQNGDYDEALSIFSGIPHLFGHDPALTDETEIWMLRAYTEAGNLCEAERRAGALLGRKFPERLERLFAEHYADLLIRKGDLAEAIIRLPAVIARESGHTRKKRLQFLLGQLYAVTGEDEKACRAFEEVKGLSTPFELTLNATVWQSALASGEQQRKIARRLKKMEQKISDTDTATFLDQRRRIFLKVAGGDTPAQASHPPSRPAGKGAETEIEEKCAQYREKIVSLATTPDAEKTPDTSPERRNPSVQPRTAHQPERETPEALQRRLEENAAKALQLQPATTSAKSRKQALRERKRQQKEKVRRRKQALKEREHKREAEMKQRERERKRKTGKQQ